MRAPAVLFARLVSALLLCAGIAVSAVAASAATLPSPLVWSTYGANSDVYDQVAAIGRMLRERFGVALRVLPGGSDVELAKPLAAGQARFAATGFGIWFAQEGVHAFADRETGGPMPMRLAYMAQPDAGIGLAVASDLGIRRVADLAGRRIAWVNDAPVINMAVEAMLRFGGLGWSDVTRVEVPGIVVAGNRFVTGDVDAFLTTTRSGLATKASIAPRGLSWVVFPQSDTAGWRRLRNAAPWMVPQKVTAGAAVPDEGLDLAGFPAPLLVTRPGEDAAVVHTLVGILDRHFPEFRGGAAGAEGWSLDRQVLRWVIPWHEGAIRYFIEKGLWTPAEAAHQARLVERQETLRAAWDALVAQDIEDDAIFLSRWQQARAAALQAKGFDPILYGW